MSAQKLEFLDPTPDLDSYRDVWVFIEQINGEIIRYCFEGIAAARKIAGKVGMKVGAVVLGYGLSDKDLNELIYRGADYVIYSDNEVLKDYNPLSYTPVIVDMVLKYKPWAFIFMADELGRDLAPRIAYRLRTGLATDNIDFEVEDFFHGLLKEKFSNILAQVRPDFATRIAKIYTPRHRPQIASLRPGYFKPLERDTSRKGELIEFTPNIPDEHLKIRVLDLERIIDKGEKLTEADLVISLGLGILRDAEGNPGKPLEVVEIANKIIDLVEKKLGIKAALGASRALIHADISELKDIITPDLQVGQTGKTVSPKVYIAVGISGAIQHKVGMMRSRNIVAINIDRNAPIFDIANYGIIEDLYTALPKLYSILEKKLKEGE